MGQKEGTKRSDAVDSLWARESINCFQGLYETPVGLAYGPKNNETTPTWGSPASQKNIYIKHMGVVQNYFAWGPPNRRPIAVQSRSLRFQSRSHVGHRCCFCFSFRCLGSDVARMGRASLVKLVQSPSNRRPTAVQSRNVKLWFAASSLYQ